MRLEEWKNKHPEQGIFSSTVILRVFVPMFLIATGLFFMTLHIPGWSLIVGLPLTLIGVVFLIYTYDEVISRRAGVDLDGKLWPCSLCHKLTKVDDGDDLDNVFCSKCKSSVLRGLEKEKSN
jgi:hypothetical protein